MKKLLYPIAFALTAFLILYSCSTEEEDTTPPPQVQQPTPEPEPPAPTQYTLTVTAGEGGTVSTEGGTYDEGTEYTITATPAEGYEFVGWEGSDSTETSLTVTLGANTTLNALFGQLPVLILPPSPSKMFTKGVADTLSIGFTSAAGFKSVNVEANYGTVEVLEQPEEGANDGNIVVQYTPTSVENNDFFRTIAGENEIEISASNKDNITIQETFKIRTQPQPIYRNYMKSSVDVVNDSYLRLNLPLIRFINKKDNKWNGVCGDPVEDFGYNKYGNLYDGAGVQYSFADINGDGYDDILTSPGDSGMLVGGGFDMPEKYPDSLEVYFYNDGEYQFQKLKNPIAYYGNYFIIPGDFDNDGDADFYLGNDGKDYEPFPGEINIVLENKFNEGYEFIPHQVQGPKYNHQASVGDIDKDGDLDITTNQNGIEVGLNSSSQIQVIIENKGGFVFEEKLNVIQGTDNLNLAASKIDLIDINNDGFLDLFHGSSIDPTGTCNGMDSEFLANNGYQNCPDFQAKIFLGNGSLSYSFDNYLLVPDVENFHNPGGNVFCMDLNNDGNNELIIGRSGTESGNRFGTRGYFVQIISHVNGELIDKTSEFIQDNYEVGVDGQPDCQLDLKVNGLDRLHDLDGNGRLDLYNIPPDDFRKFLHWEWNGSRFIKVSP